MKKSVLDYISSLHGYRVRIKEIHWGTDNDAVHRLADSIDDYIREFEDEIAEDVMGWLDEKISLGDLEPLVPNAKNIKTLAKEIQKDAIEFRKTLKADETLGIQSNLEALIGKCNKWAYKSTQK